MFGANMLARRALLNVRQAPLPRASIQARSLHVTSPVLKKKKAVDIDNLFDDLEIVDESLPEATKPTPTKVGPTSSASSGRHTRSNKLSTEERKQKVAEIIEFMKPRIGRKPEIKASEPKNSAWLLLLQYATTEEELKAVVDLMPAWSAGGRSFTSTFSEKFVRRCEELKCPLLALEVYGNFAKYNVSLTLPAGRQLLHSLHRSYPIENLMTASALFGLYNLPAAAQDYISCAIIVNSCLRHNSPDSLNIANALLPHLRKLEASTTIDKNDTYHRENVWVQRAMASIEELLKNPPEPKAVDPALEATADAPEQTASP